MEKMPYRPDLESDATAAKASGAAGNKTWWRHAVPVLSGTLVTLRELQLLDAPSLFGLVTAEEVARFISPPPATLAGFERFITWALARRAAGESISLAVVPAGQDAAVGLFQVREIEPGFGSAEWGFAIGSAYWGSGIFLEGARLVVDFTFNVVGARRLEARSAIQNGRGNGALRKVGAVQEGVLRRSFLRNGEYVDQMLWSILDEDWRQAKAVWGPKLH
jgi:[ribosomal protein S5]-alanine N-acetyltransferase